MPSMFHHIAFRDGLRSEKTYAAWSFGGQATAITGAAASVILKVGGDNADNIILGMQPQTVVIVMLSAAGFLAARQLGQSFENTNNRVRASLDEELEESLRVMVSGDTIDDPRHAFMVGWGMRQLSFEQRDDMMALVKSYNRYDMLAAELTDSLVAPQSTAMVEDRTQRLANIMYRHQLLNELAALAQKSGLATKGRKKDMQAVYSKPFATALHKLEQTRDSSFDKKVVPALVEKLKPYGTLTL